MKFLVAVVFLFLVAISFAEESEVSKLDLIESAKDEGKEDAVRMKRQAFMINCNSVRMQIYRIPQICQVYVLPPLNIIPASSGGSAYGSPYQCQQRTINVYEIPPPCRAYIMPLLTSITYSGPFTRIPVPHPVPYPRNIPVYIG